MQGFTMLSLPDIATEDQPGGTGLHDLARLVYHVIIVSFLAAGQQHQCAAGRSDECRQCLLGSEVTVVFGPNTGPAAGVWPGHLHQVGTELGSDTGGVINGIERVPPASLIDGRATRVRPDDERHAVSFGIGADLAE